MERPRMTSLTRSDATISQAQDNSGFIVSFDKTNNNEYAYTTSYLQDVEQIIFIDEVYNIYSDNLFSIEKQTNQIIEGGETVEIKLSLNEMPNDVVNVNVSTDGIIQLDKNQL